jgi:hypothetical protein
MDKFAGIRKQRAANRISKAGGKGLVLPTRGKGEIDQAWVLTMDGSTTVQTPWIPDRTADTTLSLLFWPLTWSTVSGAAVWWSTDTFRMRYLGSGNQSCNPFSSTNSGTTFQPGNGVLNETVMSWAGANNNGFQALINEASGTRQQPITKGALTQVAGLWIGGTATTLVVPDGYIAQMKVFTGLSTNPANLIHHWPMNEGPPTANGGTIFDVVGGLDGTLITSSPDPWTEGPIT